MAKRTLPRIRLLERLFTSPHHVARGNAAEAAAARFLSAQGLDVLARNVRTPAGEIDLIAREGATLCFVEVKARRGRRQGGALAAVTPSKQARLARAAALWCAQTRTRAPLRFDVLALDYNEREARWTYLRGAFEAPAGDQHGP